MLVSQSPGGGGGSLSWLEDVRDAREKGYVFSGVDAERANRGKVVKIAKNGERGIQIAMIRVLAVRLNTWKG